MPFQIRSLAHGILLASLLLATWPSRGNNYYDWSGEIDLGPPSGWADYFKENARIRLGPERRLPNGVSWRLLKDLRSGIAIPRVTWMPNRHHLRTANQLLATVHGGEMLVESNERRVWQQYTHHALQGHALEQWDVDLTYVGPRLMSIMSGAYSLTGGSGTPGYLRGLTFDLEKGTMTAVSACSGGPHPYATPKAAGRPSDYWFVYGELLQLCDEISYRNFVALVKEVDDARPARHLPPTVSDQTKGCVEWPHQPLVREEQEYALYLTFSGLAVQIGGSECPVARRADNPIIVPYRRLKPFMLPGPWRDELLALR
jgi:hypothetical protein